MYLVLSGGGGNSQGGGCENELTATLSNEVDKTHSGIGSFDDAKVVNELLPGVGEDASHRSSASTETSESGATRYARENQ